jgi:hypothetical protein
LARNKPGEQRDEEKKRGSFHVCSGVKNGIQGFNPQLISLLPCLALDDEPVPVQDEPPASATDLGAH